VGRQCAALALALARGFGACVVGGGGGDSGRGRGVPCVDAPLGAGLLRAVLLQRGVDDPEELQREVHRHLARRQHELLELRAALDDVAWVSIQGRPLPQQGCTWAGRPRPHRHYDGIMLSTRRATQLDEHVGKLWQVKLHGVERRWVLEHALQLAGRFGDRGSLATAAPQGEYQGFQLVGLRGGHSSKGRRVHSDDCRAFVVNRADRRKFSII
jgi:hypothetical protein